MKKKGLPDVIVSAVISLYYGVKKKVRVGSRLSKEFWALVVVYQESARSPLIFASSVDVIMKYANVGLINKFACR